MFVCACYCCAEFFIVWLWIYFLNETMNFLFNINVCRVCMQNEQSVDLCRDSGLQQMFTYTTRLAISEKDNLPKSICSNCAVRLRVANKFIKTAHESENNLKRFLAKISTEFKEVTQNNKYDKSSDNNTEIGDETLSENDIISLIEEDDRPTTSKTSTMSHTNDNLNTQEKRKLSPEKEYDSKRNNSESISVPTTTASDSDDLKTEESLDHESQNSNKISSVYALTDDILLIHSDNNEIEFANITNFEDEYEQHQGNAEEDKEAKEEETEMEMDDDDDDDDDGPRDQNQLCVDENLDDANAHSVEVFSMNEDASLQNINELTELNLEEENRLESLVERTNNMQNRVSSTQLGYLRAYETMLSNQVNVLHYNDDYIEENSIEETHLKDDSKFEEVETFSEILDDEQSDKSNPVPVSFSIASGQSDDTLPKLTLRKESASQTQSQPQIQSLNRFFCEQCNRDFSTKTNLNRHMLSHEGNKPHACPECAKSFSQKSSLKLHMYTHTGERPYVCDVCNRGFTQCKSLIFHMRRHTGEKPFQCEYCLVMFRQKDALRIHILKHHVITEQLDNGMEVYICIICQTKFETKSEFKIHMKLHTATSELENIEFITDEPNENGIFKAPGTHLAQGSVLMMSLEAENLDAAIMNVSASSAAEPRRAKKFQCRKCYKCFALKRSLIRHMRIHYSSAEAEVTECVDCDIQFESAEDYQEHLAEQHQVVCSQCPDLIFKNMQDLKTHMIQHGVVQQDTRTHDDTIV